MSNLQRKTTTKNNTKLDGIINKTSSSIFVFGDMTYKNQEELELVDSAQHIKYDLYALIEESYILQDTSSHFVCVCKKCEQSKANAIILFDTYENLVEYVNIIACGTDLQNLDEQGKLLTTKYMPFIKLKI